MVESWLRFCFWPKTHEKALISWCKIHDCFFYNSVRFWQIALRNRRITSRYHSVLTVNTLWQEFMIYYAIEIEENREQTNVQLSFLSVKNKLTKLGMLINKIVMFGVLRILKELKRGHYIQKKSLFGAHLGPKVWLAEILLNMCQKLVEYYLKKNQCLQHVEVI